MNKFKLLYALLLAVSVSFYIGCDTTETDDDPVDADADETLAVQLATFMEGSRTDAHNQSSRFLTPASTVDAEIDDPSTDVLIIDLRAPADVSSTGKIKTSHQPTTDYKNMTISDLADSLGSINFADYDKVYMVCASGQTAAYATYLLQAYGVDNVTSMKFGMSSWNSDFDVWSAEVSNDYENEFEKTANDKMEAGKLPELTSTETNNLLLMQERIEAVMKDWGNATITASAVMSDVADGESSYYIVNYWPEDQYLGSTDPWPGHIPTAINYEPADEPFKLANDLRTLPNQQTIVLYCYTGQTSAYTTAYLRLLGYDCKSLLYGANGMIHDVMPDPAFDAGTHVGNYDYE
jgi:rhodanese-related sulfurtransferase